jgi:hypothetical protein
MRRRSIVLVAALGLAAALSVPTSAAGRPEDGTNGAAVYHRRAGNATTSAAAGSDVRPIGSQPAGLVSRAQTSLAASLGPQGVVDLDPRSGTPRIVSRLDGFLTAPSTASATDVALDYVGAHRAVFGLSERDLSRLRLVEDYVDVLGTHHLVWEQRARGIAAWDHGLRAHVTADGRLVAVGGSPLPDPSIPEVTARISARAAISIAHRDAGAAPPRLGGRTAARGPQRATAFASGDDARLVLFGTGRGPVLAWRTTAVVNTREIYLSIVDATTGVVLWRANMVKSDQIGSGDAWGYYPSVTVPNGGGVQQPQPFPVVDGTSLFGNNAWTWPDVDDDNAPDREIPATSGLDWSYPAVLDTTDASNGCSVEFPCTWTRGVPFSWRANAEANAVQVYHYLNTFHDHLLAAPIGFTEAAGNFQVDNPSGEGVGGDPVVANVLDGADTKKRGGLPDANHVFNANMFTPPDGDPPLMQMYLFPSIPDLGTPSANAGDDASVVYHEYAHGLSSRLVTYADGSVALNAAQAGAMGEALSDFYAMDLLVSQGFEIDTPAADVIIGRYLGGGAPSFIRFEAIDCTVGSTEANCPGGIDTGPGGFTYGDFGSIFFAPEVHADGEIWVQTMWDIRTALGSDVTLALVTRGMELAPPEPSFLDMRNAMLQADQVAFAGAHLDRLWQLFAHRGMGYFAVALDGADVDPEQDFSLPPVCPGDCGTVTGTVLDSGTGEPMTGIQVAIAGHASGIAGGLVDVTDADGGFTIDDVPFHDHVLTVLSDEHEPVGIEVNVNGLETVVIPLTRDWASIGGGATQMRFTGPDYSPFCGPSDAWDASLGTGWGSDHPDFEGGSGTTGPRINVVRLPEPIDISAFGFATNGTCGDGPEAAVRVFEIQTRTADGKWEESFVRSAPLRRGVLHTLSPRKGTKKDVLFVKLIMRDNYGDPLFMDVLELSVRGRPA